MLSVRPEPRAPQWPRQKQILKMSSGNPGPLTQFMMAKYSKSPAFHFLFFFFYTGLQAWPAAWIMQKQLQLLHRQTVHRQNKTWHNEKKKKENKDVALTLACIIFTVKTMILTCKEEYSFFVKNKIPTTNLLYRLCQCFYDFFFLFSVTCMSSHIFAKRKFSDFLTIRSVLTCGGLSIFLCTFL